MAPGLLSDRVHRVLSLRAAGRGQVAVGIAPAAGR